jgi:hypothetical protein
MIATRTFIDETRIQNYKDEFAATNCIFVPQLLSGPVLDKLLTKLESTTFETKYEKDSSGKFGEVLFVPLPNPAVFTFQLLLNNRDFFSMLEEVTGCATIENFMGRIHRSIGGDDHGIAWHSDNSDNRLLAITLCLGTDDYTGGKLQLRKKESENIIREFGQLNAGDAIIFKISAGLQHRLTTVDTGKRTVGVGWFRSAPDFNTFASSYLRPY